MTTQRGIRSIPNPATRRFKTQMAHLRYPRMRGMFYADIMEPKVLSPESQHYAHIIGNGRGFVKVYPMAKKNESIHALDDFVKKVGIPEALLCNNDSTMERWGEWKKLVQKYSIDPKYAEPYSPFQKQGQVGHQRAEEDGTAASGQVEITETTLELFSALVCENKILLTRISMGECSFNRYNVVTR